jgi:hypothetical protein
MNHKQPYDQNDVEGEIVALHGLKHQDLIALWIEHYHNPPPKPVSRKLLIRAIAYALQVKRYGGLPRGVQKELLRIAREGPKISPSTPRRILSPGTRLLRDWHGRSHCVEVTDSGFQWNGRSYHSLSMIAREITGSNRNGPKFFGL